MDFLYFIIYIYGLRDWTRSLSAGDCSNCSYFLLRGLVVVSSHSAFIHYIEVELVLSAFKRTLVFYPYRYKFTSFNVILHLMNIIFAYIDLIPFN